MIITVCGSSRFKKEILDVVRDLTLQGHIVLAPGVYHHMEENELPMEVLLQLDNLHKEKIEMSDAIFVVNVNGYIGNSTYSEIDWAQRKKKQIAFLVPIETPEQNTTATVAATEEPADAEPVIAGDKE